MPSVSSILNRCWLAGTARPVRTAPLLLGFALAACGNEGPTGMQDDEPSLPTEEAARTTAVDTAVIGNGVFTARLGESRVNQFGWTITEIGLHIRNTGMETLAGRYGIGGCSFAVRLYRSSDRSLDAAWDPLRLEDSVCAPTGTEFEVGAGQQELAFLEEALSAGLLGDSLPDGWYHPTLIVAPFGILTELTVDSVELVRP